jgi:phosphate transport system substrate-binding protein
MRRSIFIVLSILVSVTLLISACAPQAAGGGAAAPAETTAPAKTAEAEDTGMLPEVNPGDVTGNIITAGSSTVYPLTEAVADLFRSEGYVGEITIASIGSGAGFERFCKNGETDISNASRPIKGSEVESCQAIGREPIEFRVGTDALAIVVNPNNDFLTSVTLDELAMIFSDKALNWSDVNPTWPAEPIKRYSPGTDSGTYDYFIEAVMQPRYDKDAKKAMEAFQNARNLQQSEDDNVLVQGVQGDRYAIGYFGFAYLQENSGAVRAVAVDDVDPNADTTEDGSYPLARPLFIYSDAKIMKEKPQVAAFISFYLSRVNEVVEEVGYFPASDAALEAAMQKWLDALK